MHLHDCCNETADTCLYVLSFVNSVRIKLLQGWRFNEFDFAVNNNYLFFFSHAVVQFHI